MDNFANASFAPDLIAVMQSALEGAVSTLPHPVSSSHIKSIAESILRSTNEGERDSNTLQTMALLELQISPRTNVVSSPLALALKPVDGFNRQLQQA
jgi:hypothetical protein